ncbi:hypothetical protein [Bradyrhizobium ottawaense]|uniref:hypothetical protein n=1 Tax=Bradyrhizobium ottawaense TaxID=931866 RepID=UPI003517F26E
MKEVRDWAKVAAEARRDADRLPFGQRETGLEEIAKRLSGVQWSTQTLRRALAALEASERLQAETGIAAADLQAYPLAAVEYASRLFRRDPEAAKIAIGGLLKGEITVAQLKRLDAELHPLDREIGRGLKARFRKSREKVILNAIEEKTGARLIANPLTTLVRKGVREGGEDPLRIPDFLSGNLDPIPLYGSVEYRRTVALIVGPYGDPSIYQSQAFDWVAKAKALLAVFRFTILVLPEDCPVKPYQYWRAMLRARDDDLMLLKISADSRGEFLEDPHAGRELDGRR